MISIHVPLAGDDGGRNVVFLDVLAFLSTSPLRGTTPQSRSGCPPATQFLSTSHLRGTTVVIDAFGKPRHISIHVPLAGDDPFGGRRKRRRSISIHVPLAGDDLAGKLADAARGQFLSTSPLRGTTQAGLHGNLEVIISIHVPLAGDDRYTRQSQV